MIELLRSRFAFQLRYIEALVADLSEAEMTAQPAPGMNHPAWLLGHLAWAADFVPALLGGASSLDEEWSARFGARSRPIANAELYPDKATLLETLRTTHTAASQILPAITPQILALPFPEPGFRSVMPTIGDGLFHILTTHEATHTGQLSAWRRALELPPAKMLAFAEI